MSSIKNRKQFKKEFEELTQRNKNSISKKVFSIKEFKKLDEIIDNTPLKQLDSKLINFLDKTYTKKRKTFIFIQAFGLFLIVALTLVIYLHLIQVKQIWTFIWFVVVLLVYLILDNLTYSNFKKTFGAVYDLIQNSKKSN